MLMLVWVFTPFCNNAEALKSHYEHDNWSCGGNKERSALHNIPMQSPLWCDVHRNKKTAQTKKIKSSCRSLIRDPNS